MEYDTDSFVNGLVRRLLTNLHIIWDQTELSSILRNNVKSIFYYEFSFSKKTEYDTERTALRISSCGVPAYGLLLRTAAAKELVEVALAVKPYKQIMQAEGILTCRTAK